MKSLLSFDQYRLEFRLELFMLRQSKLNCSEICLIQDANLLEAILKEVGYELPYQTVWGRKRCERAIKYRVRRWLEQSITNYLSVVE